VSKEDLISPIMEVLGNYRNEVRKFARAKVRIYLKIVF